MWEINEPKPVKLITGILACDERSLAAAGSSLESAIGPVDFVSDIWHFDQTRYYADEIGPSILRQFASFARLIDPGELADLKHKTNTLEQELARSLALPFPRPVNLDPGIIEPSKLVLATTKNYSHRIYIGRKMYAEVTLVFDKGAWRPLPHTYPDYGSGQYFDFLTKVRGRLLEQLRATAQES
jgi:hypothetical protein